MSVATWNRLAEFKATIEADFANTEVPKQGCPPQKRVHLVYAHYAARPKVDLNVAGRWYFVTLKKYKSYEDRPRYVKAALDYLGGHFNWVLTKDVIIKKLPKPPTEEVPVPPTAVDGGTVVLFESTNFEEQPEREGKKAEAADPKAAKKDDGKARPVIAVVKTPLYIQDWGLVHQFGEKVPEKDHPPEKKKEEAKKEAPPKPVVAAPAPAGPAKGGAKKAKKEEPEERLDDAPPPPPPPEVPTGDLETGPLYPKWRRLCLSQIGSTGEHKVVDAAGARETTEELIYHNPQQDEVLRHFCVAPWFNFVLLADKVPPPKPAPPDGRRAEGASNAVLGGQEDWWVISTRDMPLDKRLYEVTSGVDCGTSTTDHTHGIGIDQRKGTSSEDLGTRFRAKLGRSRWLVFKAMRDVEGRAESIQTWDGDKLSWGINQWTLAGGDGELWQILAYVYDFFPDAFARRFGYFGIGLWFRSRNATWEHSKYGVVYNEVVPFRINCCGKKTSRGDMDAILHGTPRAGAGSDTPPARMWPLAAINKLSGHATTSYAMSYVFTTAGADPEIQKAQAQWMSYRLTRCDPRGKPMRQVIDEFLISLGASADRKERLAKAFLTLGGRKNKYEVWKQAVDEHPEVKGETRKQRSDRQKAILLRAGDLAAERIKDILDEEFTDDDADLAWIRWPTRCEDAGKSMVGKLIEHGDGPKRVTSVARTNEDAAAAVTGQAGKGALERPAVTGAPRAAAGKK